jgi:uncharacterized protein (DUF1499 family)
MADEDPRPPISKKGWWVIGATALAGAFAMVNPNVRRLFTISDVTTGVTPEYPELRPQVFPNQPELVFEAAVRACEFLGWRVVAEDFYDQRIHAEIPVPPGLIDDFDVWLNPTVEGTAVHVRSHARVGRGDLGLNARHIRLFQRELSGRLLPQEFTTHRRRDTKCRNFFASLCLK